LFFANLLRFGKKYPSFFHVRHEKKPVFTIFANTSINDLSFRNIILYIFTQVQNRLVKGELIADSNENDILAF